MSNQAQAKKQPRIKRVFSSAGQVIHLWANQSQDSARSHNVFFEGRTIYSYGRHYELGRIVTYNGVTVALINETGYSVTTRKHIGRAFAATRHLLQVLYNGQPVFGTDKAYIELGLLNEQAQLVDQLMEHFKRLKFAYAISETSIDQTFEALRYDNANNQDYGLASDIRNFNWKATRLGFNELVLDVSPDFVQLYNEHLTSRLKRQLKLQSPEAEAKRMKAAEAREKSAAKKVEKEIENWKSGGMLTSSVRALKIQKIRIAGNEVQTTGGAAVPLDHALRLLNIVLKKEQKAIERVGQFTLNQVIDLDSGDKMLKIGCHNIMLSEAVSTLTPKTNAA